MSLPQLLYAVFSNIISFQSNICDNHSFKVFLNMFLHGFHISLEVFSIHADPLKFSHVGWALWVHGTFRSFQLCSIVFKSDINWVVDEATPLVAWLIINCHLSLTSNDTGKCFLEKFLQFLSPLCRLVAQFLPDKNIPHHYAATTRLHSSFFFQTWCLAFKQKCFIQVLPD